MNLSEPFIRRPVMTTLVMATILFFGILGFLKLPVSDLPDIESPTIEVNAQNPGSDAELMAATVATVLEQQLMTVDGLRTVISTSQDGNTNIVLFFDLDRNVNYAMTDVAAAIQQAAGNLPPEMPNPPTYKKYNPASTPVMFIAVSSDSMTLGDLYDFANTAVAQRFSMVTGVSQVSIYGAKKAVRIKLNPDKIHAMGIGIDELAEAVAAANQQQPAGTVYDAHRNYTLNPLGQMTSGEMYEDYIVLYKNGAPVRIKDIGEAITTTSTENLFNEFWNADMGAAPSIVLAVSKQPGYNTVQICNTIVSLIPQMKQEIPPSVDINVIFNQEELITRSIRDVEFTLILAFCLVVVVIFLFLGRVTATIIPSVTLPMSIIGTFAIMYAVGFSIDVLSMLGLVLVIGFLVDDAIVVLENNVRHIEMGKTAFQAALDGSKQISTTVLSMTLSLASVFIPLAFMPGMLGRLFHEFSLVVVCAVLFSGLLSLTLTPLLCSRFIKADQKETWLERQAKRLFRWFLRWYEPALRWVLHWRIVPVGIACLALLIAFVLFFVLPQDFLPPGDTGCIQGVTVSAQGVSPLLLNEYQGEVSKVIRENPYVDSVIVAANIPQYMPPNQGVCYTILKPEGQRPPIQTVVNEILEKLREIVGIIPYFHPLPEINLTIGTSTPRAEYQYAMYTVQDPNSLYGHIEELTNRMKTLPELDQVSSDVQVDDRILQIEILRDRASTLGISADTIETALSLAYAEGQLSLFSTQVNTYQIIMELEDEFRRNPNSLEKLYLRASNSPDDSGLVPLRSVVRWETVSGPLTVNHVDQLVAGTIFFNLSPGAALGTAVEKVQQIAQEVIPSFIIRGFQGQALEFEAMLPALFGLLVTAVFVIYVILGILYESFLHPLTILSALPGALFGAMLTLWSFHGTLSIYTYVGMVVLMGIVMKNGIMLVEFANELVRQGIEAKEAIVEASVIRFRPILMTTVAAAMGAVPIAFTAGSRQPMGLVILGGLIFAQLITYFFTPVVYLSLEQLQGWLRNRQAHGVSH